mgnify:CR=1 FL=1
MDYEKIGALIRSLRTQQGLTQRELAQRLTVSDKAVSKWERGQGCPDVSLLPEPGPNSGRGGGGSAGRELLENEQIGGTMKNLNFYVCPTCGNILTSAVGAAVTCCGKKLAPLEAVKAPEEERLNVELIENDYFVSSSHPMTKEHYVSFVALVTGDTLILRRLYPGVGPADPPAPNRPREALLVLRPARPLLPAGVTGLSVVY